MAVPESMISFSPEPFREPRIIANFESLLRQPSKTHSRKVPDRTIFTSK